MKSPQVEDSYSAKLTFSYSTEECTARYQPVGPSHGRIKELREARPFSGEEQDWSLAWAWAPEAPVYFVCAFA